SGAQTDAATGSVPPGTTPATAAQPDAPRRPAGRPANAVDGPSTAKEWGRWTIDHLQEGA
ncbi:MAG: hypothetical protein WAK58_27780, partial [Trebonia sp.]